ncbi:hypothetical protein [Enterococcus sp. LJL51]|uniref:hypothetical protein n=1 Tax=Enterococcus sp. LJL51 TaxID=3416656 RepID=UPI003CEC9FA0
MKVKRIVYPTTLDKIEDITNDNIDVFVELEDGFSYTIIVATLKNIETLMRGKKFLEPGLAPQFVIVKELNEEVIAEAIEAHAIEDDGYWIKLSHVSTMIDAELLDKSLEGKREFCSDDEE